VTDTHTGRPRCGETTALPFGTGHAICTREPHLPDDPWHQDDQRHRLRWKTIGRDDQPAETCRPVQVDGQTVRVLGAGEMTERERQMAVDIVLAARRRFAAEMGGEPS
jgi:hypothetical protein